MAAGFPKPFLKERLRTPKNLPKPFLKEGFWTPKNLQTEQLNGGEDILAVLFSKTLLGRRVLDSQELIIRTIKRWGRYPRRFVFYHKILLLDIELLTKAII